MRSQRRRFARFLIRWHAFNALASFCARVNAFTVFDDTDGVGFPGPENVALAGDP